MRSTESILAFDQGKLKMFSRLYMIKKTTKFKVSLIVNAFMRVQIFDHHSYCCVLKALDTIGNYSKQKLTS